MANQLAPQNFQDCIDACAAECEKYEHGYCKSCAQACRRCADACRWMAAMAA